MVVHAGLKSRADHRFMVLEWTKELNDSIGMDLVTKVQLLKDIRNITRTITVLGMTGEAYLKTFRGKEYLILKGRPGTRPSGWNGTRFLAKNKKVKFISVGVRGLADAFREAMVFGIVSYVAIDVARALFGDLNTIGKFVGTLGMDILKCLVASAAGFAVGAGVVLIGVAGAAIPMIFAVAVGVGIGMMLDDYDKSHRITQAVCHAIDDAILDIKAGIKSAELRSTRTFSAMEVAFREWERKGLLYNLYGELETMLRNTFPGYTMRRIN